MNLNRIIKVALDKSKQYTYKSDDLLTSPKSYDLAMEHHKMMQDSEYQPKVLPKGYEDYERQGFAVPTKNRPIEKTPEQVRRDRLKTSEEWGYQQGQDQSNPTSKIPTWVTAPTETDPQRFEEQQASLSGFHRAQQDAIHDITGFQASYTHYLPNFAVRFWNSGTGQNIGNLLGTGESEYNIQAPTYFGNEGKHDYRREYAQQAKESIGNPYSDQGMAMLEHASDFIGKTPFLARRLDTKFYNNIISRESPDGSTQFQYAPDFEEKLLRGIGNVEEFLGREVVEESPRNAVLALIGGPLVKGTGTLLAKVPGATAVTTAAANNPMVAKATEFLTTKAPWLGNLAKRTAVATAYATAAEAPRVLGAATTGRDYGMLMGNDKGKMTEEAARDTYGDEMVNEMANAEFVPVGQDEEGNLVPMTLPPNATQEQMVGALGNYSAYMTWLAENNIPEDKMNDEDTKLAYGKSLVNGGAPHTEYFNTSMFRTLSEDHQVELFDDWLLGRWKRDKLGDVPGEFINDLFHLRNPSRTTLERLAQAMREDTTGVYADGFNKFITNASVDTILKYMEKHSNGTGNSKYDTDIVFDTFGDALVQAMKNDHSKISPMLQGCIKLQAVKAARDGKDPGAASKGVNTVKTAFKEVLADPEVFEGMEAKDKLALIKTLAEVYSNKGGPAMLGEEGDELAAKVLSNLQDQALELAKTHPEMWSDLVGAYLMTKGMPELGEAVSNPWVFWSGIGTVLFGGALAIGSVFDSDEDDGEEEDDNGRAVRMATDRLTGKV